MKQRITITAAGLLTAAVCLAFCPVAAQVSDPTAIIVKYTTTHYHEGKPVPSRTSLSELAVKTDGSVSDARVVRARDGKVYLQRTITDVTTQQRIVVDGITESLTTYLLSSRELQSLQNPRARCASLTGTVPGKHLNFDTLTTIDTKVPDRVIEFSYAPDLGCVLLRKVVRHKDARQGQFQVVAITEATSVELGEAGEARFTVPAWKERSPSAVIAEYERKLGLSSEARANSEDLRRAREAQDKAYYASQTIR